MMTTREMYTLPSFDNDVALRRREIAAVILAIAPLFLHFGVSTTFNGIQTQYIDFADVLLGIALLVAALGNRAYISSRNDIQHKMPRLLLTGLLMAVALIHIVSGLGLLLR